MISVNVHKNLMPNSMSNKWKSVIAQTICKHFNILVSVNGIPENSHRLLDNICQITYATSSNICSNLHFVYLCLYALHEQIVVCVVSAKPFQPRNYGICFGEDIYVAERSCGTMVRVIRFRYI